MKSMCSLLAVLSVTVPFAAVAEVPGTISYQGILTDAAGSTVADGDYSLTFRLYDAPTGGSHLWEETKAVTVSKGIFSVILGAPSGIALPFDVRYYLGISVGGESELTPRIELTASACSITSRGLVGSTNTIPPRRQRGDRNPEPRGEARGRGRDQARLDERNACGHDPLERYRLRGVRRRLVAIIHRNG